MNKNRPPAMQFYFRQFAGDEHVLGMDLDAVGAHILLMCMAGASCHRFKIDADERAIRNRLRNPNDADFERIKAQLLSGAWKVSDCGKFWEQDGMRRSMQKQKEYSKKQQENARARWGMPSRCQTDANAMPNPMPKTCSSSTSASTTTSTNKNSSDRSVDITRSVRDKAKIPPKSADPQKIKFGDFVFLTDAEKITLEKNLGCDKFDYYAKSLDDYLAQNPKRKYASHARVISNWARRDAAEGRGVFKKNFASAPVKNKTAQERAFENNQAVLKKILGDEGYEIS